MLSHHILMNIRSMNYYNYFMTKNFLTIKQEQEKKGKCLN